MQATKQDQEVTAGPSLLRALREAMLFCFLAIAAYLLIALATYHHRDPAWSYQGPEQTIQNAGGVFGAWFADIFLYLFGYLAFLFPLAVAYGGWLIYRRWSAPESNIGHHWVVRIVGFMLTLITGAGLSELHFRYPVISLPLGAGGVMGDLVGEGLALGVSFLGATLFLLALFLLGTTLLTGLSWFRVMDETGRLTLLSFSGMRNAGVARYENWLGRKARQEREEHLETRKRKSAKRKPPRIEPVIESIAPSERTERERQAPLFRSETNEVPPLSLLDMAKKRELGYSKETLEAMSRLVEKKLQDFGIDVTVEAVHPGPVITRFEVLPAAGVKVSQITNLNKDLARALSVTSLRVVEVIPGKSVIGLEIPNEQREVVLLSEILNSRSYDNATSPVSLALGKDIGGNPVVVDLAKMPHLLVAGTTGSGKSVAINAMLLSILYKTTAKDVRLIMIDPKMLELSVYDGIPHLLAPVVTNMKEAANALRWCVAEMERRYRLMAALGVRNISGYNRKIATAKQPIPDPLFNPSEQLDKEVPALEALPYVVVVVDELADLMMVVGKKVEELIARLAQKARAAGVHLILATQRPSVDVITGLIKANIPTRIAFQVSSRIDSRTIIDQQGAETLLGHGDMLYLPPGSGIPQRVHGAFVADHEVHQVVRHLKGFGAPEYLDEITCGDAAGSTEIPGLERANAGDESDPLYDEAVRIVTETRRASVSGIQRRLKIGYNRAARMVEQMELAGVVGPLESNGSREVLVPPPPEV